MSSPTDADFGGRDQLCPPPRPQGGKGKEYTVLIALSGPTGIAVTRKYPIDAVVLDFEMPAMGGNQVAQVMVTEKPTLPIVISSGSPDEIPESLTWSADAVLHKGDGSHAPAICSRDNSSPCQHGGRSHLHQ